MEFTKAEQRILSLRYEKWDTLLLWMGVLSICVSIGLVLFHGRLNDQLHQKFEETELSINNNIEPSTDQERKLKGMLLRAITGNKKYMLKYFEVRYFLGSVVLFFMGEFFIVIYFMRRRFIRLIRKLQQSPNNCMQPIAEKLGSRSRYRSLSLKTDTLMSCSYDAIVT